MTGRPSTVSQSARPGGPGVRVSVDAMGGDFGAAEVVPGAIDHARSHPEDQVILVGDATVIRSIAGELPSNVSIVPGEPGRRHG